MSSHSDDLPIIYGTEFQARALCAQTSNYLDPMPVRFMVGTLSLKNENKIHLLEFHDEITSSKSGLHKLCFKHDRGEVWDISCSSKNPNLFTTCYSTQNSINNFKNCTIWKYSVDLSNNYIDEEQMNNSEIISQYDLNKSNDTTQNGFSKRISLWHPEDGDKIVTMEPQSIILWDVETGKEEKEFLIDLENLNLSTEQKRISEMRWSPHSHCSIISLAIGNQILAKDTRVDQKKFAWKIDTESQVVKSLDFNPNAQYYLASSGEDCQFKLWDVRNTNEPVITMLNHSHWVWSVRYNLYHDQLILTCSSDCRVVLSRISSFASQPFGHLIETDYTNEIDESDTRDNNENLKVDSIIDNLTESTSFSQKKLDDGVVSIFLEHEDSVYSAEWSNADPWIFASLSYDGRLIINKVPKEEKYNLLI